MSSTAPRATERGVPSAAETRYVSPVLPRPRSFHLPSCVITELILSIGTCTTSTPIFLPPSKMGVPRKAAWSLYEGRYSPNSDSATMPGLSRPQDRRNASPRRVLVYGPLTSDV